MPAGPAPASPPRSVEAPKAAPPELPRSSAPSDCLSKLGAMGVEANTVAIGPQPDDQCTVAEAVQLIGLKVRVDARVRFPDQPTIACATAETFAAYVRDLLFPLAKGSYGV